MNLQRMAILLILTLALIMATVSSSSAYTEKTCDEDDESPFAIFKPLVINQLSIINEKWNCVLCNLPEDVSNVLESKICSIQNHMKNAVSLSNPVYVNSELFKANNLINDIISELDLCCMDKLIFDFSQNDGIVTLTKGTSFNIQLEENPSTGFMWEMTFPEVFDLQCDKYAPYPGSEGLAGAGGTHSWSLLANDPGTYEIKGVYKRSWEQQCLDDLTFELTVIVV